MGLDSGVPSRRNNHGNEILCEDAQVSMVLLLNRVESSMRVIDLRPGDDPMKRAYVRRVAREEGIQRLFTVVERDHADTWRRMGFVREGTVAGFFAGNDAHVLGTGLSDVLDEEAHSAIVSRRPSPAPALTPELAFEQGKERARALLSGGGRPVRLQLIDPDQAHREVVSAAQRHRALTVFAPFGRDAKRRFALARARGFSLLTSVEVQRCFGSALIELLESPRTHADAQATRSAILAMVGELQHEGVNGCFAVAPADDPALCGVYLSAGFRRTARLGKHLRRGPGRADAFVWSRRLASPHAA